MRRRRSGGKPTRRGLFLLASAAVAGLAVARSGASEITSTWSGNTGDWTDATQWSTNPDYPNNDTPTGVNYDAVINAPGAGAYTVSLSSSITVDSVTLNSPNATISQTGGTLTAGALNISAGTYSLSGGAANFSSFNNTGGTFASSGNSNIGFGFNGSTFNNAGGAMEADLGSEVDFSSPGSTTTAQLGSLVTNGGTITLNGYGTGQIDNAGQTLTFSGSTGTVKINNIAINEGAVSLPSTVVLRFVALTDVTFDSDVAGTEQLQIQGVNAAGHSIDVFGQQNSLSSSTLSVVPDVLTSPSVTLTNVNINLGGGLNSSGGGYIFGRTSASAPIPLTLDTMTTVRGFGGVGFSFGVQPDPIVTNQGLIVANISGQTLQVANAQAEFGSALTNTGTLQAANGGVLDIDPSFVSSFGGWTNNGSLDIDDISSIQVNQGLTFAAGSSLNLMLGNSEESGLLSVDGGIDFNAGAALNLAMEPGAMFSGPYEIATYTGSLSGVFSQVNPGFVVDYSHPGEILVTAIPEPTGIVLVVAGAFFALARRRRDSTACQTAG
jgi:hypothetical protein